MAIMFRKRKESNRELADALVKCGKASAQGYEIATDNAKSLIASIDEMKSQLATSMGPSGALAKGSLECRKLVKEQYDEIIGCLDKYQSTILSDLEKRWNEKKNFSIVVFGRTMAGKSTLMSILTRGNEEFIGKGAQRTTRDVRRYSWKGLEVIDVPGIAAFGGEEDTRIAFEAAQTADLALFLMTDDGNIPEEIQGFADLRNSGKDCLGVVNVQDKLIYLQKFPDDPSVADGAIMGVNEKIHSLDTEKEIRCFEEKVSAKSSGGHIDFTIVHLLLSQLSQHKEYAHLAEKMRKVSQVGRLMWKISQEVVLNGPFLRVKGYVDTVVKPMVDGVCVLFRGSAINASHGRVMLDKVNQVKEWRDIFVKTSDRRLQDACESFTESMLGDVDEFVESNYENTDAVNAWQSRLVGSSAYKKWIAVAEGVGDECSKKLNEIQREIEREFSFVKTSLENEEFDPGGFTDARKVWNWSVHALSSVLVVAAIFTGGVTAAIAAVASGLSEFLGGIFSGWFESKEEKIRRARTRLANHLEKITRDFSSKQNKNILDAFYEQIKRSRIDAVVRSQLGVTSCMFGLADSGRHLAKQLIVEIEKINHELVVRAMESLGYSEFADSIVRVARIPGNMVVIAIKAGVRLPDAFRTKFSALIRERVIFVVWRDLGGLTEKVPQADKGSMLAAKIMIKSILHNQCELHDIRIESKLGLVHLHINEQGLSPAVREEILNGIKLAEQITSLHIVKEEKLNEKTH